VLLADGEVRRLGPGTTPGLNGFAVTPDGERALVCCDVGCLYEVHLRRRRVLGAVGRHDAAVLCVACSPDGRYAVTGSWDRTVRVWDLRERSCVGFWEGLGDPINSVAFAGRSDRLWLGTFNGEVIQWDWRGGELERAGRHHGSVKLLSPGRRGVVSVGRDGSVRSWADGASSRFQAGETILNGVSVAEKSGRIATVSRRNGVEIWDDEGAPLARFDGHPCSAKTVHWSADEHSLAVGYYDGYVAVWQPEDDELRLERICDASVSQVRFVGDDLVVSAWDAEGSLYFVDPEAGGVRDVLPVGR
jgi:WD40 repeat protein